MAVDRIGDGLALRSKGDIVSHDGTTNIVISPGTNGQILTAQSSTTSGLQWVDGPTTPTEYWIPIAVASATTGTRNVTVSNISGSYEDIVILFSSLGETTPYEYNICINFNSDTTNANYGNKYAGWTRQATTTPSLDTGTADQRPDYTQCGMAGGNVSRQPTMGMMRIYSYATTSHYKLWTLDWTVIHSRNNYIKTSRFFESGDWQSTSAITSITFASQDATYGFYDPSRWHIYGIKRSA